MTERRALVARLKAMLATPVVMFRAAAVDYKPTLELIVLTIVIGVGVLVRLQGVGYNFDGDEVFSVAVANNPFRDFVFRALQDRPHPPLYYLMLHLWTTKAFGASEAAVRALSILFSVLFLVIVYRLLRRLVSVMIALAALTIFVLSPFFVYYGAQARPYALIALLTATNLYVFVRLIDAPRDRRHLAAWSISCVLIVYAQYLGTVFVVTEILFAVFRLRSGRRAIVACGALACALILPWLIMAIADPVQRGNDPLITVNWISAPGPRTLAGFYLSVFGSVPGMRRLQYSLLAVLFAILAAAYVSRMARQRYIPAAHILMFGIAVGVPVAVYVLSVWGPKPVFLPRQLVSSAVAFVVIVALCVAALPSKAAAIYILVLLPWVAAAVPNAFPHNSKPPWRELAAEIDGKYGSVVVAAQEEWVRRPLTYYRTRGVVRLWSAFDDKQKLERFLVVCRPESARVGTLCSEVASGELQSRSVLVDTWRWNFRQNELHLYDVTRRVDGRAADESGPSIKLIPPSLLARADQVIE